MESFAESLARASARDHRSSIRSDTAALSIPDGFVYADRRFYRTVQRTVDIVAGSLLLLLTLPLLAVAAAAIFIEDRGPVLFVQHRVGRFERLFTMYKLRTMHAAECRDSFSPITAHDARITKVGRWLRTTSIDELPQLWNVLRGEMTLVGPRPEMPFVVARYQPWQHLRHLAVPGVTGLWQVTCRSRVPLRTPEATLIDLQYIRRASILTDVFILAKTLGAVMRRKGAF